MYKVKVNHDFNYTIEQKGTETLVNGVVLYFDMQTYGNQTGHIIYQNKSFNTEIIEVNKVEKTCLIKVNGDVYSIAVEDQFDQLLKQLGMDNLAANKVAEIKAPMPGLVLKVLINEGDEIKKGDNLLVLEAMKMENIIKSSSNGSIKKILVKQGDKVEKNQILIGF